MRKLLTIAFLLCLPGLSQAAQYTICSSGCTYTLSQLQTAVNAASPGDIITIAAGQTATTTTGLILPVFASNPNNQYLIIRSSSIASLPANVRVSPTDPNLATISYTTAGNQVMCAPQQGITNCSSTHPLSAPTVSPSFIRFEGIKFIPLDGDNQTNMITLGSVVDGGIAEHEAANQAHDFVFDRCVFSGYPGSKDGFVYRVIMINCGKLTVENSYFYEIKGWSAESQALSGWNDRGPFYFINNHIEAGAMSTLLGGAIPNITGIRAHHVVIRNNEYYKPYSWRFTTGQGTPATTFSGRPCQYDSRGGERYADVSPIGSQGTGGVWVCSSGTWVADTDAGFTSAFFIDPQDTKPSGTTNPTGGCSTTGAAGYYENTSNSTYWVCDPNRTGSTWVQISQGQYYGGYYLNTGEYGFTCPNSASTCQVFGTTGHYGAGSAAQYEEKNLMECKNCQDYVAEGNYIHNAWMPTALNQNGACLLLNQVDADDTSANTNYELAAVVYDVRFLNNQCDSMPWGLSMGVLIYPSAPVNRWYLQNSGYVTIKNNLYTHLGNYTESYDPLATKGNFVNMQWGNFSPIWYVHNTIASDAPNNGDGVALEPLSLSQSTRIQQTSIVGNILAYGAGTAAGFYAGCPAGGGNLWNAVDNCLGWTYRDLGRNVVVDSNSTGGIPNNLWHVSDSPRSQLAACPDCTNTPSYSSVGFVNYGTDWHLSGQYAGTWAYGKPAGANIDEVNNSTSCALSGCYNQYLNFRVRNIALGTTSATFGYVSYDSHSCTLVLSVNPDFSSPTTTVTDTAGPSQSRTLTATGLTSHTNYFWQLTCATSYERNGQLFTH